VTIGPSFVGRADARPAGGARRGRPRNVLRRREIARLAVVAFADHGYHGCTMTEIAARCSISKSLLSRYFSQKESVLAESLDYVHERLTAAAQALRVAASRNLTMRELMLVAGNVYVHHVDEMSAWYAAWLGGLPIDTERRKRLNGAEEALYVTFASCIGARAGVRDPYVLARSFFGALQSLVLLQNRAAFEPVTPDLRRTFLEELVWLLCDRMANRSR
jgi:AcrR family transcriptional regulator